jgi:predicted AAA+ superfamily ATPase
MDVPSRIVVEALLSTTSSSPISFLCGASRVGKTALARALFPDIDYFDLADPVLFKAISEDPIGFVQGLASQAIIDDIQRLPTLIPVLNEEISVRDERCHFLLISSVDVALLSECSDIDIPIEHAVYLEPFCDVEKAFVSENCEQEHWEACTASLLLKRFLEGNIFALDQDKLRQVEGISKRLIEGGFPEPLIRTPVGARRWFSKFVSDKSLYDARLLSKARESNELPLLLKLCAERTAHLLNNNALAAELGVSRVTAEKYTSLLESAFLVRRLPAWHSDNPRIIKAPKLHVIDSGLSSYLRKQKEKDWSDLRSDLSGAFESYVVQQIIAQSRGVSDSFSFSHYRDKDQNQIALVIERGNDVWGVEVKKSVSSHLRDGNGLRKLAELVGDRWQGGLLIYTGNQCEVLESSLNCYRVPASWLWETNFSR